LPLVPESAAWPALAAGWDNLGWDNKEVTVAIKRVYEPPARADGVRVLVDRLWPRGLTKEAAAVKHWLRDLAPSTELRQWYHANPEAWPQFRKRYMKELADPKATAAVEKLYDLVKTKKNVTLLYASRNEKRNNATVLKDLIDGGKKPPSNIGREAIARQRIRKVRRG